MRIDGCETCGNLPQPTEKDNFNDIRKKAIIWFKHFDEHPNPMNWGSASTLADFFRMTEDDLK